MLELAKRREINLFTIIIPYHILSQSSFHASLNSLIIMTKIHSVPRRGFAQRLQEHADCSDRNS